MINGISFAEIVPPDRRAGRVRRVFTRYNPTPGLHFAVMGDAPSLVHPTTFGLPPPFTNSHYEHGLRDHRAHSPNIRINPQAKSVRAPIDHRKPGILSLQPLQGLISPHPVTAPEATPITTVLATMERRRISCLLAVDADNRPTGIFTEQDAVRLMADGKGRGEITLADVMQQPVFTVQADLDYREAYRQMSERGFRHLVVVDAAGRLSGIVSEGDFLHHLGMEYLVELKTVASAMTPNPVTLPEQASLAEAIQLMASRHFSCVLATRDGAAVGIVTERDLVHLAQSDLDPASTPLAAVMHGPVTSIAARQPVQEAARRMQEAGIRRLAVVDGERLVGLITRHDIVKSLQGRYIEYLEETIRRQRHEVDRTHGQLQDLRQRLRSYNLMEQVSDAIFVIDAGSAALVEVNEQACRSLGYSRDELLALTVPQLSTFVGNLEDWHTLCGSIFAHGQIILESGQRRRDGSILPVQVNARLVQADGHDYVVSVARDLTAFREQSSRLQLQSHALDAAANAIVITDTRPGIIWTNAAFTHLTGYTQEEALGRRPADLVRSGLQDQKFYQHMWDTILSGQVWHGELINKRRDGSLYDEELTITPVSVDSEKTTHFIAIKQDITARKAAERALRESEDSYRGLFHSVTEAIFIIDESGYILDVNRGAESMYGYRHDEFLGCTLERMEAPGLNDREQLTLHFRDTLAGKTQRLEFWGRRKNGQIFPSEASLNRGRHFGRNVIIAVARDVTEHKALEDSLRHLAATDTLTGLANRRRFLEQMNQTLARFQRHASPTALLMVDLDWFKRVNDHYGHATGDEVLRHVARGMTTGLRRGDLIGRLGGEEFAILLADTNAAGAHEFAERLRQRIAAEPTQTEQAEIPITLSIGVTAYSPTDAGIDTILARADRALYRAKAHGRNRVEMEAAD